jgi:ribonuclease HI
LGVDQQCAFENIKRYLSSPPVMKAPKVAIPFWLYITAYDVVIGAMLTQVTEGNEHIITYLSRCLIDTETRYSFIEKLCLSMFYACSKLRHYLLSSTCVVDCQVDVIKHMLQ